MHFQALKAELKATVTGSVAAGNVKCPTCPIKYTLFAPSSKNEPNAVKREKDRLRRYLAKTCPHHPIDLKRL